MIRCILSTRCILKRLHLYVFTCILTHTIPCASYTVHTNAFKRIQTHHDAFVCIHKQVHRARQGARAPRHEWRRSQARARAVGARGAAGARPRRPRGINYIHVDRGGTWDSAGKGRHYESSRAVAPVTAPVPTTALRGGRRIFLDLHLLEMRPLDSVAKAHWRSTRRRAVLFALAGKFRRRELEYEFMHLNAS